MEFDWSKRTIGEWRYLMSQSQGANWMQSWPYAQASYKRDRLLTKLALVKEGTVPLAIVAIQQIKLGPVQIVNLNRGPLWLIPHPTEEHFLRFAELFRKTFPKSLFQRLRWMPNWDINSDLSERLKSLGFHERKEFFLTSCLDLKKPLEQLRSELDQKWRNCLNKALKSGLEIHVENQSLHTLGAFLNHYASYKSSKKFRGPTPEFLREELCEAFKSRDGFLLLAEFAGESVAGLAILTHGNCGSYRVGWNSRQGRSVNAHYALIWKSVEILKQNQFEIFDLGGLLPDEAQGVTHFKNGLNGERQLYKVFGGG